MKRNCSLVRVALVLATGCAVLVPTSAPAPTVQLTILQPYLGFSQSIRDPNVRGPAELIVTSQVNNEWAGRFTIDGNTYSVTGEIDSNGVLDFTSRRGVTGDGKCQDLTRGGQLVLSTYKLKSGDRGKFILLLKFDNDMPPDIAGSWAGTYESALSLMRGTVQWNVQQDRMPSGAPGTWFTGRETLDTGTPAVILYQYAGTIDDQGNFVRIGNSDRGFVLEGGKFESDELTAHSFRNFVDGGQDDLVYVMSRN